MPSQGKGSLLRVHGPRGSSCNPQPRHCAGITLASVSEVALAAGRLFWMKQLGWVRTAQVCAFTGRSVGDVQSLHSIHDLPPAVLIYAVHLALLRGRNKRKILLTLHLKDHLFIQSCANFVGLETGLKPSCNHPSEPETTQRQLTLLLPAVSCLHGLAQSKDAGRNWNRARSRSIC